MKKLVPILIGLFLILNVKSYSQNTSDSLNKAFIALENCDSELNFYKDELYKCNQSDSLKTKTHNKVVDKLNRDFKTQNRKTKIASFFTGAGVGALIFTIIKILI